jgi:two-component system cell cycle response regulator DivK
MSTSKNSILVVDDNPANAALVSFLLTKRGYEVRIAADAAEALAIVGEFAPRLIMMDIQLPGMDGLELTRRLKADPTTRQTIIIALTAYAMKGDEERARQAGCDGYVSKPIDTRTLPGLVAEYLPLSTEAPDGN